jgi:hypothetical protein
MQVAEVAVAEQLVAVLVALVVQAVAVLAVITTSTVQPGLQIQAAAAAVADHRWVLQLHQVQAAQVL